MIAPLNTTHHTTSTHPQPCHSSWHHISPATNHNHPAPPWPVSAALEAPACCLSDSCSASTTARCLISSTCHRTSANRRYSVSSLSHTYQ